MEGQWGWLALIGLLGSWAEAEACSCRTPSAIVLPVDGSVGVPTNVMFLLGPTHYQGDVTLRGPGGTVAGIFGPKSLGRQAPPMPLEPNTDYRLSLASGGESSSFRTGSGPDHTPPSLTDFDFTAVGSPPIGSVPCGRYEAILFDPKGAADVGTPVEQLHYDFYFGPTPATVDLTAPRVTLRPEARLDQGGCSFGEFPLLTTSRISGALAVVDWAGNRSLPTQVRVLKGCGCAGAAEAVPFAALALLLIGPGRHRSGRAISGR